MKGFRTVRLSRGYLEGLRDQGRKIEIRLIGLLFVDQDVQPELVDQTVSAATIYGTVFASPQVKETILSKETC